MPEDLQQLTEESICLEKIKELNLQIGDSIEIESWEHTETPQWDSSRACHIMKKVTRTKIGYYIEIENEGIIYSTCREFALNEQGRQYINGKNIIDIRRLRVSE